MILRSPFSRVVDRGIVLLTVTGRRTGRRFSFPVQYVQEGDVLWVMSGAGPEKTWWRNLVGGAPVQVLLRRHAFDGTAQVATYPTDPETVSRACTGTWRGSLGSRRSSAWPTATLRRSTPSRATR